MVDHSLRCFVIGPIGNRHAEYGTPERDAYEEALEVFDKVIKPACKAVGLDPVRADQIAVPGEITEQVFRRLLEDEVVVADLSGGNPNVMYELGLRHTTKKLTVQIGEYGQLPFDVNSIRTILFSRSERGLIDARKELQRALEAGLLEGGEPVAATRVWQELHVDQPTTAAEDTTPDASISDDDKAGWLDRIAELESSLGELPGISSRIEAAISEIASVTSDVGKDLENSGGEDSARRRLKLLASLAQKMDIPARDLEISVDQFEAKMKQADEAMGDIITAIKGSSDLQAAEDVQDFINSIHQMAETTRDSMEGVSLMGAAASGMGNLSRVLREPGRRIERSVRKMVEATSLIDEWDRSLSPLARNQ
ncbi:hypothetical protein O7628_10510 [Micromonospora sp. WMMD956]|uniref:hypothetical protein n=1 Tax=Micromonospora sp. WMMD956 TaxID=3016108 RepID=UPI0024159F5A|nr:hypothetical protein [Micromonospora sp. WMMD956]MDG4815935.1 hypothetical protein [Micromonospora sp. WMMD956]